MKKKMSRIQLAVRIIIASAITAAAFAFFFVSLDNFVDGNVRDFSHGWTVNYNGQVTVDADLYTYRFSSPIRRGDIITMRKRIPLSIGDEMILTFDGQMSAFSVKVDGRNIYSYGYNLIRNDKVPGNASHVVLLPTDAAGKTCEVSIEAGIDYAFTTLPMFHLVPAQNETACYTNLHIMSNVIAFFLFTMGMMMIIACIVSGIMGRRYELAFSVGSLAFTVGIWAMCTTHVIEMFSRNYVVNTHLGCLMLYVSVIPLLSIMYFIRKPGKGMRQKAFVGASYASICTLLAIVIIMDFAGRMHPAAFLLPLQIASLIAIVLMVAGTTPHRQTDDGSVKIYFAALAILFAGCIADMIRYYLSSVIRIESRILFTSIIPAVSAVFIMMIIVGYLVRLRHHYLREAELEIADQIAFTDVVTGLRNRTYCNDLFERLEGRSTDETFQIVSFDINGVTKVNDTLGRAAGDMLIKDSAAIISRAFAGIGDAIRMGGDEFIVVIENGRYRDVKTSLSRMEKLEAQYEFRRKYEIRLSYGAASSDEKEGLTPEAVYHRATERMYAMKKETRYSTY